MTEFTPRVRAKQIAEDAMEELEEEVSHFRRDWPDDNGKRTKNGYSDHQSMVAGMIDSAYATGRVSGYSPKSMAGAAIYAAGLLFNQRVGMQEVADAVGCGKASISAHYENMFILISVLEADRDDMAPRTGGNKKDWVTQLE